MQLLQHLWHHGWEANPILKCTIWMILNTIYISFLVLLPALATIHWDWNPEETVFKTLRTHWNSPGAAYVHRRRHATCLPVGEHQIDEKAQTQWSWILKAPSWGCLFPTVLFWLSGPELSQVRGDTPLATCWVYSPYCLHMPRGTCAFPELCGTTITRDNNLTDLLGKENGSQAGACEIFETWAGKQVGRRDDKSIWEKPQRQWNQTNSRFIELKIKCGDKVDGLTDKAKLD